MGQCIPEVPLTVGQRIVKGRFGDYRRFEVPLAEEIDRAIGIAVRDALRQDREKRACG